VFLFIVGFIKDFDESSRPARMRKLQNAAKKITAVPVSPGAIPLSKFLFASASSEARFRVHSSQDRATVGTAANIST
jgi:hypothetical protein